MAYGDKEGVLESFRQELETEGYDVVEVEPIHRTTITEQIEGETDDSIGFVVVSTPVELRGEEFDGNLVLTVYEDRVASHGVDVYSHPDDPLPAEKRKLLTELVPPQKVKDDQGNYQDVWTYYPPPQDLPDKLIDDNENNVDELVDTFDSVYQGASGVEP